MHEAVAEYLPEVILEVLGRTMEGTPTCILAWPLRIRVPQAVIAAMQPKTYATSRSTA